VKHRISPGIAAFVVVIVCSTVLVSYWKGLVGDKKLGGKPKMAGGGGSMASPLLGSPDVTVRTLAGNGEPGLKDGRGAAARFDGPNAVVCGPRGVLYVTDSRNHRLRQVGPGGEVLTLAGSGPVGTVAGGFADGPAATARLSNPSGVVAGPDGTVFFTDTGNHRVRFLKQGVVGTLAGGDTPADEVGLPTGGFADGPGPAARFRYPTGLLRDADGSLLVVDTGNLKLRRVTPQGVTSTVADLKAAGAVAPFAIAAFAGGYYLTDPGTARVLQVTGGVVRALPGLGGTPFWKLPTGVAVGDQLYLSDAGAHCLNAKAAGPVTLLAGVVPLTAPMAGLRDGTGAGTNFAGPAGLALGADRRTLYVADYGNNCLRVVKW
jgi:sugar lactone lactonase YvrE